MPRAQVRVLIQDDSFVMPGTESGGTSVCGIVSSRTNNLVKALGNTLERSMGYMTIDSSREWMDRLNSNEPTGYDSGWAGTIAGGGDTAEGGSGDAWTTTGNFSHSTSGRNPQAATGDSLYTQPFFHLFDGTTGGHYNEGSAYYGLSAEVNGTGGATSLQYWGGSAGNADEGLVICQQYGTCATGGNIFAGGNTYGRWPIGPTGDWAGDWWTVNNYLAYGGVAVVATSESTLQKSEIALDFVIPGAATAGKNVANSGLGRSIWPSDADVTSAVNVATNRQDCIAVIPNGGTAAVSSSPSRPTGSQASKYVVEVYGAKIHGGIDNNTDANDAASGRVATHCSPDVAGIMARTDRISDPWISPAGFRRGGVMGVDKMEYVPSTLEQDRLYDGRVNFITTFPNEGTVLWGDKTTESDTSTFSRINVSRLFIHLKKIVGPAARSLLFEQNDSQTRTSFVNAIEPFLTRIKNRKGIYDFRVICDETNNTGSVVDANQFIADVFVKPAKSINYVQITFTNKNTADSF
jgi:hypothetical protein